MELKKVVTRELTDMIYGMKTLNVLLLLIFGSLVVSCADDDKDRLKFDAASLQQTTWKGTWLLTDEDQVLRSSPILMQFFTYDTGHFIYKQNEEEDSRTCKFKYSIEGKMMKITDAPIYTHWTLVEMDNEKMVLEAFEPYKSSLVLHKQ